MMIWILTAALGYLVIATGLLSLHKSWYGGRRPPAMAYVVALTWPLALSGIVSARRDSPSPKVKQ